MTPNYWDDKRWSGWPSPMNYTRRKVQGGVHCAGEGCERFLAAANVRNCDNRALCDNCFIREASGPLTARALRMMTGGAS